MYQLYDDVQCTRRPPNYNYHQPTDLTIIIIISIAMYNPPIIYTTTTTPATRCTKVKIQDIKMHQNMPSPFTIFERLTLLLFHIFVFVAHFCFSPDIQSLFIVSSLSGDACHSPAPHRPGYLGRYALLHGTLLLTQHVP